MLMYKHLLVHGIIGYHKLKETHKDHQVKSLVLPELTKIKNVVQLQLEPQQAWCPNHFSRESFPMTGHFVAEYI